MSGGAVGEYVRIDRGRAPKLRGDSSSGSQPERSDKSGDGQNAELKTPTGILCPSIAVLSVRPDTT